MEVNIFRWILFVFASFSLQLSSGTRVTEIFPKLGSVAGETLISIIGSGFSEDVLNEGNEVLLVSTIRSYDCPVLKDGTTEAIIMCYTPQNMLEGYYWVRLKVDGSDIAENLHCGYARSSNCRFLVTLSATPTITAIEPSSGPPGSLITITGRMFTSRYGSNIPTSTNGRREKILRVYAAANECELLRGNDEFYGLTLFQNGRSDYGYMVCKLGGTFIGNNNASFIIEGAFGRSLRDKNILHMYFNREVALFQTYAEITSVSPREGSIAGGTTVTITGVNFDDQETKAKAVVKIADTDCVVESVSTTEIVCKAAAKPSFSSYQNFTGNRGLLLETWNETYLSLSDMENVNAFSTDANDYSLGHIDQLYFSQSTWDIHTSRIRGFFVPPRSGNYLFLIKADDSASLWLSNSSTDIFKEIIAHCPRNTRSYHSYSSQKSERIFLQEGQSYYIEIHHNDVSGGEYVRVAAHMFNSTLTEQVTGKATQEVQRIRITSNVVKEVQNITLNGYDSNTTAVHEVQEVEITVWEYHLQNTDLDFPLSTSSTETEIAEALQSLPVIHGHETVSVSASTVTDGVGSVLTVTFNSERGDFPLLTYRKISGYFGETLNVSVSEQVKGEPSGAYLSLMIDSIPVPLIKADASALDVHLALNAILGGRCPHTVTTPSNARVHYDFERSLPSGIDGAHDTSTDAFCGFGVVRNPTYLYRSYGLGISLGQTTSVLCFAHKGRIGNMISLTYIFEDSLGDMLEESASFNVYFNSTTGWRYSCFNMLEALNFHRSDGSSFIVKRIWIRRMTTYLYIDEVYIGMTKPISDTSSINLMRMSKSRLNGVIVNTFAVKKFTLASGAPSYIVTFYPDGCGCKLPIFRTISGQVQSGSSITLSRLETASCAIGGTFDMSFGRSSATGIPVTITASQLESTLNAIPETGELLITKQARCEGSIIFTIKFLTNPGDQDDIMVSNNLTGRNVAISIETLADGYLLMDPIPGDMLRTLHDKPQVLAYINTVPTKCSGDCSFEWTEEATAQINGVSPTSGNPGATKITISGTGFHSNPSDVNVTIGNSICNIKSATVNEIVCDVGDGPNGTFPVIVTITGKGKAYNNGNGVVFTYNFYISNVSRTTCSVGGGCPLTVTGVGFAEDDLISIGNVSNTCKIKSRSTTKILSIVPPSTLIYPQDIMLLHKDKTTTVYASQKFSYLTTGIARIDSLSQNTSNILGGDNLTLFGTNFDNSSVLSVCDVVLLPQTFTTTEVTVQLLPNRPGTCEIHLLGWNGLAVNSLNVVPTLDYVLYVQGVSPRYGSLYGGSHLTIIGQGFSTKPDDTVVMIGSHECATNNVSSTSITCTLEEITTTHLIDNSGVHYVYGKGYEWNPRKVSIYVGDIVRWTWTYPIRVVGMTPRLTQVDCHNLNQEISGGFSSGRTGSKHGTFQHRFTQPGTFCFSSGYIDIYRTLFSGVVEVHERLSTSMSISVTVGGFQAVNNISPGVIGTNNADECLRKSDIRSGCQEAIPVKNSNDILAFALWSCATPVISSVSPNSGTMDTIITVSGTGFSSTNCLNEVKFGVNLCEIITANESEIRCRMDPSSSPQIGILYEFSYTHLSFGIGLVLIPSLASRSFALMPLVTDVNPKGGSRAGGTRVTISGSGFQGQIRDFDVTIGGYTVDVVQVSYQRIVVVTKPSASGVMALEVKVRMQSGSFVPSACSIVCMFIFDPAKTPILDSVTPKSISGNQTTLTITGSRFGSSTTSNNLYVTIGGESCTTVGVSDTSIKCTISHILVGQNAVNVYIAGFGLAEGVLSVLGLAVISSISPLNGSINGGTDLTIRGHGFISGSTFVEIDTLQCLINSVSLSEVNCTTPSHREGTVQVDVSSAGISYPLQNFSFSVDSTPQLLSISPFSGSSDNVLTLIGSGFGTGNTDNTVFIGGTECIIISSMATSVKCMIPSQPVGTYPVMIKVKTTGYSNQNNTFEYLLDLTCINPSSGSTAGGQTVTIEGSGFDSNVTVSVCGFICLPKAEHTQISSKYICTTADSSYYMTQRCNITITQGGISKTFIDVYTYNTSLTPEITNVTPRRGGTGGGTALTISGSGFGTIAAEVVIDLDGNNCTIKSLSDQQIICMTSASSRTFHTKVRLERNEYGIAMQTNADFHYVDVWSSPATWGGLPPPTDGDLVVIQKGHSILLDIDTAELKMLLVKGGELIFDEQDLILQAENILVTEGGLFQIGTEAEPFQHKAKILLRGHYRTKELPIYGTKNLGIREGRLELHGKFVPKTWTRLEKTAVPGDTTIILMDQVTWEQGDHIVIATTNHQHSQGENEERVISSINNDRKTITLTSPLSYTHLGVSETFGNNDLTLDFRAEVGLLTRTVKVEGFSDPQWNDATETCPRGFDIGQFAVHTCLQGRFGEEIGSDQFGAHILLHAPRANTVTAHIEYIEVKHAGQAFRLGRHPIHFHLLGDMTGSYVRGCSIHDAFNRAVNIHDTHNVLIEHNVLFDIMGGAMFLEDGIEKGNTFQYNLAINIHMSTRLQNDDVTPAAFWVTNPDNNYEHNSVAGGTHFGFWYRLHAHPAGPSSTNRVCCQNIELRNFYNNTVHSQGWYGLWISEAYTPRPGGECFSSQTSPAVFDGLFVWNCRKGIEFERAGALQVHNSILVNNQLSGFEVHFQEGGPPYTNKTLMLNNATIVGHATSLTRKQQGCTRNGIIQPLTFGVVYADSTFINFDESNCAVFSWTGCSYCGGYTSLTWGLRFINSPNRIRYSWTFQGQIKDLDGTLLGDFNNETSLAKYAGNTVVTCTGILPQSCLLRPDISHGITVCACPNYLKLHRFAFNNPSPILLRGRTVILTTQYGSTSIPWKKTGTSHFSGWEMVNLGGEETVVEFINAGKITSLSYTGVHYEFDTNDFVVIRHKLVKKPDRFMIDGRTNINDTLRPLNVTDSCDSGDWEYNEIVNDTLNSTISFSICGSTTPYQNSSIPTSVGGRSIGVNLVAHKCYYKYCIAPKVPPPVFVPPPSVPNPKPLRHYWSNTSMWNMSKYGWIENYYGGVSGLPQAGHDVVIVKDSWVIADMQLPYMYSLRLYGTLEFDSANGTRDFVLNCSYIIILGGRLIIGTAEQPFLSNVHILLNGDPSTTEFPISTWVKLGSKALGVFGGLDLHGKDVGITWTTLANTANEGENHIVLTQPVEWQRGDDIVITSTSYFASEAEAFGILDISDDKTMLRLNGTLKHRHIVTNESGNGWLMEMRAEVGLLSRNIKIEGAYYKNLHNDKYGARILVSRAIQGNNIYTGYTRISNVEFYHTSQNGYSDPLDPRLSIAYVDTGAVTVRRPSYVKKCSFHHVFGSAVGVFGTNGLPVEDNVIYNALGYCLQSSSDRTQILRNLCTMVSSGFSVMKATRMVLQDNHVAGSNGASFLVPPVSCYSDPMNSYTGNVGHTSRYGITLFPSHSFKLDESCIRLANFTLWKCSSFGIYIQHGASQVLENMKMADNGNNIVGFVTGPSALSHSFANKYTVVRNSFVVGRSSSFDCGRDKVTGSNRCFGGVVGVMISTFNSAENGAPSGPFCIIKSYQAIGGQSYIKDVTFSKFDDRCGSRARVLVPNPSNEDGIHPIQLSGITLLDVPLDSMYINPRASLRLINPSDCIDMACDGLLKVLVSDIDGSFLGSPGHIISQSEYQYNGDRRRGLGDYRIPREMLTELNGTRIPHRTLAPHQGILRNNASIYRSQWQAYEVHNLNYRMMVLESLDSDSETRRLSPVAVLADGYIDLINGPQDHGWCSSHKCRRRLSTFPIIVATGKNYLIHYTRASPQKSRFMLLNSNSSEAVRVSVWYLRPNSLDLFVNGRYVMPKNGRMEGPDNDKRMILDPPPQYQPDYYMPDVNADEAGTNFFNRNSGLFTFLLKGGSSCVIKTRASIIVSYQFPPMTVSEFFGKNIIRNLAAFLEIPASKVRITDVVPENQATGRRKRSVDDDVIKGALIEIGNTPGEDENATAPGDLSVSEIQNAEIQIANKIQLGAFNQIINASISATYAIASVPPDPQSPKWADAAYQSGFTTLPQVNSMIFNTAIETQYEGAPFSTQPKLQLLDSNGYPMKNKSPWQLTAGIRSGTGNPNAQLLGNTTVTFVDGLANFSNLYITQLGNGYIIDFNITDPAEGENMTLASDPLMVYGRPIKADIFSRSTEVVEMEYMTVILELRDSTTDEIIEDISWRDHQWTATASLGMPELYNGTLEGTLVQTFDPISGQAVFHSLNITQHGFYVISFHILSDPPEYDLEIKEIFIVKSEKQNNTVIEEKKDIVVKFNANYQSVVGEENEKYFAAVMGNFLTYMFQDVITTSVVITSGSIVVTFQVEGTRANLNSTVYSLCNSIQNTTTFDFNGHSLTLDNYLTVGGTTYYGVLCGSVEREGDASYKRTLSSILKAIVITIVIIIIIVIIIGLVIWRFKIKPTTKTHVTKHNDDVQYIGSAASIEDILWRTNEQILMKLGREKSFTSISSNAVNPKAPVSTHICISKGLPSPSPGCWMKDN